MPSHHDIVAIGGSAGAIEALLRILPDLPVGLKAAVFIVVHVAPDSPNSLAQLFTMQGNLPAQLAKHRAVFRPGHVYVAPPDHHLVLERERMVLSHGPKENGFRPAIDPLFRSAAQHFGSRVIGLVLSGNLDDGVAGLNDIKLHGGMALAQDPGDAAFPGLPRNAVANVELDHVVPLHKIANRIAELVATPAKARGAGRRRNLRARSRGGREREPAPVPGRERPRNFSCPECGGAMWELTADNQLRFRCHTGHIHSAETLSHGQKQSVETAMWTAMRSLQESAELHRRMAERLDRGALHAYAKEYLRVAEEADEHAGVLRTFLLSSQTMRETPTPARPLKRRGR